MVRTRSLWLVVLGLCVLLGALPGTRDVVVRRDLLTAEGRHLPNYVLDLEVGMPPRALLHGDGPEAPAEATARRLNAAWAYAAAAEATGDPATRERLFDLALRLDPRDEVVLLSRVRLAMRERYTNRCDARWSELRDQAQGRTPATPATSQHPEAGPRFDRVTADLVTAYPDNAYAHWLRGWYLAGSGDDAGAERELLAAATAPRLRCGHAEAADRLRRLHEARGLPPLEAALRSSALLFPDLAQQRSLARWAAARAHDLPDRARAARLSLAVCRFGTRLRDDGGTLIASLVGIADQAIGARDPAAQWPDKPANLSADDEATWRARQPLPAFTARLRQAGRGDAIAWVTAQAERSAEAKRAARRAGTATSAAGNQLVARGAMFAFATELLAALSVLLLLAGGVYNLLRRRAREAHVPWRLAELVAIAVAAILPIAAGAAIAAHTLGNRVFPVGDEPQFVRSLVWLVPVLLLGGAMVVPLLGEALAAAYARRMAPEGAHRVARRALRRSFRRRYLPTAYTGVAALLLLVTLLAGFPLAASRASLARYFATQDARESAPVRAAIAAVPCPAPPADLQPVQR